MLNRHHKKSGQPEVLDISVSRAKIALHLVFWLGIMALIARVFILPYFSAEGGELKNIPNEFIAAFGDELVLFIGLLIASFIGFYMAALIIRAKVKGPSYRVSKDGLWLYNAGDFYIPRKAIRSVYPAARNGVLSSLMIEVRDRQMLMDLEERVSRLSGISCDPKKGEMIIELTGLNHKKAFTRALARVAFSNVQV